MLSNIPGGNTMNKKSLTVNDKNGVSFVITSTEGQILAFLKWVTEYKRGNYNESENTVICYSTLDMKACNLKALRMNLCVSQFTKKIAEA
jgi:hypothetical protein